MRPLIRSGALLLAAGVMTQPVRADLAETRGGVTIRTEDGRFEARFGGRIHLDGNFFVDDEDDARGIGDQPADVYFRRARLTLAGKAYGWRYMLENDFAGQGEGQGSGFREVWIGTDLLGTRLRVGQAKPYRGMEELTSSNELHFIERPFSSSNGIYSGRQYQTGLFLDDAGRHWGWGLSGYSLRSGSDSQNETDGVGAAARAYVAPTPGPQTVLHIGVTGGVDNPANGMTVSPGGVRFVGRSGPTASFALAASAERQTTYGLELAARHGSLYGQAEVARARFAQSQADDVDVDTYYVQASWLMTGESKPYSVTKGVFRSVKPTRPSGAWEAKVRYDFIGSDGLVSDRDVAHWIVGLNWFVNPSVRMMFEYIRGQDDLDGAAKRSGDVVAARLQFGF